jgi:hypothetical protein
MTGPIITPQPAAAKEGPTFPASLPLMMDGTHHTDEICIRYEVSLKQLEMVFRTLGGASEGPSAGGGGEDGQRRGSSAGFGSRLLVLYI